MTNIPDSELLDLVRARQLNNFAMNKSDLISEGLWDAGVAVAITVFVRVEVFNFLIKHIGLQPLASNPYSHYFFWLRVALYTALVAFLLFRFYKFFKSISTILPTQENVLREFNAIKMRNHEA